MISSGLVDLLLSKGYKGIKFEPVHNAGRIAFAIRADPLGVRVGWVGNDGSFFEPWEIQF